MGRRPAPSEERLRGVIERVVGPGAEGILKSACSTLIALVEASTFEGGLVVYMFGLRLGERIGAEVMASGGCADPVRGVSILTGVLNLADRVSVLEDGPNESMLEVVGSAEARKLRGGVAGPSCNFLRGLMSGFLSEVMEEPVLVEEVECCAAGAESCLFRVRPMPEASELASTSRRAIVEYLRANPGAHLRQIARDLGMSLGTLRWHLGVLERRGLVRERRKGNQTEFYLTDIRI